MPFCPFDACACILLIVSCAGAGYRCSFRGTACLSLSLISLRVEIFVSCGGCSNFWTFWCTRRELTLIDCTCSRYYAIIPIVYIKITKCCPLCLPMLPTVSPNVAHCVPQCCPLCSPMLPTVLPNVAHCVPQCCPLCSPMLPTVFPNVSHCVPQCFPLCPPMLPTVFPNVAHCVPQCCPLCSPMLPTVFPNVSHCVPQCCPLCPPMLPTVSPNVAHCVPQCFPGMCPNVARCAPQCCPVCARDELQLFIGWSCSSSRAWRCHVLCMLFWETCHGRHHATSVLYATAPCHICAVCRGMFIPLLSIMRVCQM